MSDQLILFSEPRARHDDPETSSAAAKKVAPGHQARLVRIAEIVDEAGYYGATADEIYLRIRDEDGKAVRSTWHRAVSSTVDEGLIIPRGERAHVRLSVNGSIMRIYITPRHQRGTNDLHV